MQSTLVSDTKEKSQRDILCLGVESRTASSCTADKMSSACAWNERMGNSRIRGKSNIAMLPVLIPLKDAFEVVGVLHLAKPKSDDSVLFTDQPQCINIHENH